LRGFHLVVAILTSAVFTCFTWLGITPVFADMTVLTYNILFCPSWAEAHERSLASLNHGRPLHPVKWKGCIVVERGTCVDVVEQQEQSTEICHPRQALDHRRDAGRHCGPCLPDDEPRGKTNALSRDHG
jgi:hypothetical protein